jgi:hypothetical protein
MWRKMLALVLALTFPAAASAGPLREAAEKAGREFASTQADTQSRNRGRFWTSIAIIAGGGAAAIFGGVELGDKDNEPDDIDDAAGGDDGDGAEKALLGAGIAAAALGGVLLFTGRKSAGPSITPRVGGVAVMHTVRF